MDSLSIGNLRNLSLETKRSLALLILTIVSGKSTPSRLRLWNLGFEAQDGENIFNKLIEKQFGGLRELSMHMNYEFWESTSGCLDLIKQLLPL